MFGIQTGFIRRGRSALGIQIPEPIHSAVQKREYIDVSSNLLFHNHGAQPVLLTGLSKAWRVRHVYLCSLLVDQRPGVYILSSGAPYYFITGLVRTFCLLMLIIGLSKTWCVCSKEDPL